MTQAIWDATKPNNSASKSPIHVTSEIGTLKTVLLKRPGKEVENLAPDYLERLLFDDIPYLPLAQKEHDAFAEALRTNGTEVIYLEKLAAEAMISQEVKEEFVSRFLNESGSTVKSGYVYGALKEYLLSMSTQDMIDTAMAGVRTHDIEKSSSIHLQDLVADEYPFYLDPLPNLYFTRDPAASMGDGLTINHMYKTARRRESLFMEYIIKHHPRFASHEVPVWLNRNQTNSIEGGDELILSEEVIAVGISERTSAAAIENLAINLFAKQDKIKKVLAIEIPKKRAFMHLDTVFTMVDYDKFTIHPEIQGPGGNMRVFVLERGAEAHEVKITERNNLQDVLKEVLHLSELDLILCGGGDAIVAPREQWNDGSNTLAIAPGVVVTYDRNYVSNEILRSRGIKVIEIVSGELSRGRGGPRCMSMPIIREDLKK